MIIPNTLTITIQTNIPGHQVINYTSNFSLLNDNRNKNVLFNPIFQLKQSVVNTIPDNLKIEEFFNKGLFQSLIFAHGNQSEPFTLEEATQNGIIDDNIQITLDTLFSTNNHFFIHDDTYTIADYQWKTGDWRINVKSIDFTEINIPDNDKKKRDQYIKNKILLGENQLKQLPEEVIFGPNFEKRMVPSQEKVSITPVIPVTPVTPEQKISQPTSQGESGVEEEEDDDEGETIINPENPVKSQEQLIVQPLEQPLEQPLIEQQPLEQPLKTQQPLIEQPLKTQQLLIEQPIETLEQPIETPEQPIETPEQPIETPEQPIETPEQPIETPDTIKDKENNESKPALPCPSKNKNPTKCNKKDALIFHPDKNSGCIEEATKKIQIFNKLCKDEADQKELNSFIPNLPSPNLKISEKSSKKLRDFFNDSTYYFMMNEIIQNMNSDQQKIILKPYVKMMGYHHYKHKILDSNHYSQMVNQMQVEKNSGGGDCFFIALADAINLYNSKKNGDNLDDRITYNNYGKSIIFTQKGIRSIIANYILINPKQLQFYLSIGEINANYLNDLFKKVLPNVTKDNYLDIIENIYTTNDNFLVEKPTTVPTNSTKFENPFSSTNENNTRDFIESTYYWADNTTIEIINQVLLLNVIVIEYNNKQGIINIPFPNLDSSSSFTKYLFFYYENNHYELITFSYPNSVKKVIFETETNISISSIIPPIYLIYEIFGIFYMQINNEEKQKIKLFQNYMNTFQESFQKIYKKVVDKESKNTKFFKMFKNRKQSNEMIFLTYFNHYFNYNPNPTSFLNQTFPFLKEMEPMKGGSTEKEENRLSYYITIELFMKKGEEISSKELKKIKCNQQWSEVEKAYAKFTRKKYVIKPMYDYSTQNPNPKPRLTNKTLKKR